MNEQVHFKDLSVVLKTSVILIWIVGGLWLLLFLIGLVIGTLEII